MNRKINTQTQSRHKIYASGFSLIELLVVIAIIGILSNVILSSLSTARNKAHDARSTINFRTLKQALDVYALEHSNIYPAGTYFSNQPSWDNLRVLLSDTLGAIPSNVPPNGPYMYLGVVSGQVGADSAKLSTTHSDGSIHTLIFDHSVGKCFYLDVPLLSPSEMSLNDGGIYDGHLEYIVGKGCIVTVN